MEEYWEIEGVTVDGVQLLVSGDDWSEEICPACGTKNEGWYVYSRCTNMRAQRNGKGKVVDCVTFDRKHWRMGGRNVWIKKDRY